MISVSFMFKDFKSITRAETSAETSADMTLRGISTGTGWQLMDVRFEVHVIL